MKTQMLSEKSRALTASTSEWDFIYFLCCMSNVKNYEQAFDSRTSVCAIILLHIYTKRAARSPLESRNDDKKNHKNSNLFNFFFVIQSG